MKPNKWAKEIHAWADGAEIEYRYFDDLIGEYTEWAKDPTPIWHDDDFEFRIKPQPKELQYLYVYKSENDRKIHFSTGKENNVLLEYVGKIKLEVDDE